MIKRSDQINARYRFNLTEQAYASDYSINNQHRFVTKFEEEDQALKRLATSV